MGRKLVREMDEHRSVDVKGRVIVPNVFTFWLSQTDHASFADIDEALVAELCEAAREYARDEGYHFMGPVSVDLVEQRPQAGPVRHRLEDGEAAAIASAGNLVLPTGDRIKLGEKTDHDRAVPDCTIPSPDLNVSRKHAEIRPVGNGYVTVDLGSTNGTKVNGARLDGERLLRDGDVVSVGTTHIRFEAS